MTASPVPRLPSGAARRVLAELREIGELAVEGFLTGDRELLVDCARWHDQRRARLRALTAGCSPRVLVGSAANDDGAGHG